MAWDSKYPNFGVVKIDGKKVKVYCDTSQYKIVDLPEEVTSANWAGGELNVTMRSGKVRRYSDNSQYKNV
jgi:hypothetical protein